MTKLSQAIEDYLKHIYLLAPDGTPVQGNDIARKLEVSHASVTGMLKRLAGLELVEYEAYRGVTLTERGRTIALEVVRHHRLIEAYLTQVVGMSWDEVHDEAEILEHHISERFEALMAEQLGHPEFDPHGHPIPTVDGRVPHRPVRPLVEVGEGERAVVHAVRNEHREMLGYLAGIGVGPAREVLVTARAPMNGPLTIQNDAGEHHPLAYEIAGSIDVSA